MGLTRPKYSSIYDTDFKVSCRAATTATVTLSAGAPNTLDGVTLVLGDRVLVKNQGTASQNGVYTVTILGTGANGTWTRALDFDSSDEVTSGILLPVTEGTSNGGTIWFLTTPDPITLGTTSLTFTNITFVPSRVVPISNTAVSTTATSGALVVSGGVGVNGNIFANGTVNGTQLVSNIATGTAPFIVTSTTQVANLNVATAGSATTAGTVTTAAQPNITSVGTITDLTVSNSIVAGGGYGNVTTSQYASVWGQGAGANPYSIMQVRSSDGVSGLGMQAYTGSGTLYGNTNIIFALGTIRDKDVPSSLVTKAYIDSTGLSVTGNVTASTLVSNIATGTAPLTVTSTTQVANLNVAAAGTATTAGTVTTAAQPNITSVGTLSSATTSGNVTVGNVLILSGNKINSSTAESIVLSGPDVTVRGNLTIQGGTTIIGSQDLVVQDSIINLHTQPNLAALTADDGRDIGVKMHYYKTSDKHAFVGWANDTGYLEYYSDASETGGVITGTYGTIKANSFYSNIATGTAPFTVTSTTQVANLNVATAGSSTTAGTVTTAAQPNITSVGTLSSLGVTGAVTASTLVSNVATGTAPFTVTSTTQVANLNVATAGSSTTAGTVTTAAQPNITSVGTLTALDVNAQANATIFKSNIATGTAPFTVTSTTQVANLNVATAGSLVNGNSNVAIVANANVNISSTGTANVLVVTGVGANIAGNLAITGTVVGGSIRTTSSGTAPSSPTVGDMWYNSTTDVLYRRTSDGTTSFWLDVSGPASYSINAISLIGNTLSTSVLSSSLTSVGTLSSLTVTTTSTGNAVNVTYTPSSASGTAIFATGKDTQGGIGYFDFLKVTNTTSGATNPNKTFRLTSTGGLEIINSAYSASPMTLSDAGDLNIKNSISINGNIAVNGPAFSAYAAAITQTITSGTQQKVLFQTEEFDTNSNYASSRFTPTVAGYYQLNAEVRLDGATGTGEMMIILYKNGSEYKRGTNQSGTQIASNFWAMTVSSIAYANGTGDYFEIYVQQGSGGSVTVTAVNNTAITWFNGCMLRGA